MLATVKWLDGLVEETVLIHWGLAQQTVPQGDCY